MMRSKKLSLPAIILAAAVFAMGIYSVVSNIAKKPTITEKDFAFSVTYEFHGETVTIEDVCTACYLRNDGYTHTKNRVYSGKIGGLKEENDTVFVIEENANGRILLNTKLYADYLMGDARYDYFDDEAFAPQILYYDSEENEYIDEATLLEQGVKLVSWEYPTPIENSFVFSHISICNNSVILPSLLISILALLAILIFVKKEENYQRKPIDVIGIILNFLIGIIALPIVAGISWFLDIMGDNAHFFTQLLYFNSALIILCIAASVALRRKSYKKSSLLIQFGGPAAFLLLLFFTDLFL